MDSQLSEKDLVAKQRYRKKRRPVSETPLQLRLYLNQQDCNPPLPTIKRAKALSIRGRKAHNQRTTVEAREREFQELAGRHAQIDALQLSDFEVQHQTVLFEAYPPGAKKPAKTKEDGDAGGDKVSAPEPGVDIENSGAVDRVPLLEQKDNEEQKEREGQIAAKGDASDQTPAPAKKKKSVWSIFKRKGKQQKDKRLLPVTPPVDQAWIDQLELLLDFQPEQNRQRSKNRAKLKVKCLTQADYIMWSAVLASACQLARCCMVYWGQQSKRPA